MPLQRHLTRHARLSIEVCNNQRVPTDDYRSYYSVSIKSVRAACSFWAASMLYAMLNTVTSLI